MNKIPLETDIIPPHTSQLVYIIKSMMRRWVVVMGMIVVLMLILVAIFAPLIAPYDPYAPDFSVSLASPSFTHFFGTDELGRDLLSRIIYGTRISLLVGIVGVSIAGGAGVLFGLLAGYYGGWINTVIMRLMDALLAIPSMVLILAIAATLGGGIYNVLIAIGFGMMPTYARLMCAQVMFLKESDYIKAATVFGASNVKIMFRHLLPNAFPPIIVLLTVNLGIAILSEAALSFLGIGILPPTAAWGSMVSDGQQFLLTNPLISFIPGMAILIVVLSFNMVGDGLRDSLDPRLRGTL